MRIALAAIASGVLVVLSSPPFGLDWVVWFALVPMTVAVRSAESPVHAFLHGAAGMLPAFIGAGYGLLPYHALLATGLPLVLCVVAGGVCAVDATLQRRTLPPTLRVLLLPSLWTLGEYVTVASGIPWALALTQASRPTLVQGASLLGMFAVSFLIVLVNAGLVAALCAFRDGARLRDAGPLLLAAAVFGGWLTYGGWSLAHRTPDGPPLRVASIQPMLPSELYSYQWLHPEYRETVRRVVHDLSANAAARHPDLLVWPENGNGQINFRVPALRESVAKLARESGATLLLASYDADEHGHFYNAVFSVSPAGELLGRYAKTRLAAGGERGFSPGPGVVPLPTPHGPVGAVVCLESSLPWVARSLTAQGAVLLAVVTSDVAMRRSATPLYHSNFSIYRAVENRRWVVQASNGGPSLLVSPYGEVTAETPLLARGTMEGWVATRRERALYTRFGDWSLLMLAGTVLLAAVRAGPPARCPAPRPAPGPYRVAAVALPAAAAAGCASAMLSLAVLAGRPDLGSWLDSVHQFLRPTVVGWPRSAGTEFGMHEAEGEAALAYALNVLGIEPRRAEVHPGGTLDALVSAARLEGVLAWRQYLPLAEIRDMPKPIVASLGEHRFAVVLALEGDLVDLFDPRVGYRQISMDALASSWHSEVVVIRFPPLHIPGPLDDRGDRHHEPSTL